MSFGSEQWMYSAGGFYPNEVDQSLRFDGTGYLSRTPSVAGNRKTFTWSGWVKRSTLGDWYSIFVARNESSGSQYSIFSFRNTDVIQFVDDAGTSVQSTAVFRDLSSWYHFTLKVDTTQATASDRVKIYSNGVEVPLTGTYPALNADLRMNSTIGHNVGWNPSSNPTFSGYMAEVNFVDGQAPDPTSFGEFKSGVWIPKEYSGTHGTNGFHLDFSDSTRMRDTDTAVVTAPFGGNAELARVEDGLAVISNTSAGSTFTLVQYDLGSAKEVKYYIIEDLYFTGNISTFQLQYSNDNSSWTSAVSFAITENAQDFAAPLSITARYWRIQATAFGVNGSARIDCLQLFTGQVAVDSSGNGNDFSAALIEHTDVMLDSPTNNFCTLNRISNDGSTPTGLAVSEGNLKSTHSVTGQWQSMRGTTPVSSGKWYYEVQVVNRPTATTQNYNIGFYDADKFNDGYYGLEGNLTYGPESGVGKISVDTTKTAYGSLAAADGDIYMFALDLENDKFWVGLNGTWMSSGNPSTGANPSASGFALENGVARTWTTHQSDYAYGAPNGVFIHNCGQDSSFAGTKIAQGNTDANGIGDFYYAPPEDYLALCSANLPDPAIDPAKDDIPADYFNPVIYQGDNSTSRSISGVGFQPDFTWIKSRTDVLFHGLADSVRGGAKHLYTNTDIAETTNEVDGYLSSFDTDGFTLTGGTSSNATFNRSTDSYISWNWKAGGAAVANTDGSIASQVSANPRSGFSVVSYTGNGTEYPTVATVGHGLNQDPEMIIVKSRDAASTNWSVYHQTLALDQALLLNDTGGAGSSSNAFGRADPTSTVFTVGQATGGSRTNGTGTYIAYCFHSVEGFSKFGSYTGNGSADGPFIYTGFRPAFVMWKNASDVQSWHIYDDERSEYNLANKVLYANLSNAEGTSSSNVVDLLSNGFKLRGNDVGSNASGDTYIYMAFAEMPFKYANAR